MAETIINGRSGNANFSINGVAYAARLTEHEFQSNIDQLNTTTFATETAPTFEADVEIARFRIAGFLTKGTAGAGLLFPLPQGATIVQTFDTGCTISGSGNFSQGVARRTARANSVIAGEGFYVGAIVKAWVTA